MSDLVLFENLLLRPSLSEGSRQVREEEAALQFK